MFQVIVKITEGVPLSRNLPHTLQYLNRLGNHDVFLLLFAFTVIHVFTFPHKMRKNPCLLAT
jgi:hypothetical protein